MNDDDENPVVYGSDNSEVIAEMDAERRRSQPLSQQQREQARYLQRLAALDAAKKHQEQAE